MVGIEMNNDLDASSFAKIMSDLKKGDASFADILTALKNLVTSVNNLSSTYQKINGIQIKANLTGSSPILITDTATRLATVSVIEAGSTVGYVYDSKTATINSETSTLCAIQNTVGTYFINMPANLGLVISPGTDQVVTVSYS